MKSSRAGFGFMAVDHICVQAQPALIRQGVTQRQPTWGGSSEMRRQVAYPNTTGDYLGNAVGAHPAT
jgi:hypothetical protein